ncbi:MAG: hypothetical protein HN348_11680, partial [Proteobacteria bacterium]|nr:hypothetical protein [Pseudomonadota bacterium]
MRRNREKLVMVFLCLCVPYLVMVRRFWFVCEDAYITFRYSSHLAEGLGPRFNTVAGELPVEGYSNFLWMVIAAVFELLDRDVVFFMPLLSTLCGLAVLFLLVHTLYVRFEFSEITTGLAGLAYVMFTPVAVWTSSGLATMPLTLGMFATTVLLLWGENRRWGIAAGVAALGLALVRT